MTYDGRKYISLRELCRDLNLPYSQVMHKYYRTKSIEESVEWAKKVQAKKAGYVLWGRQYETLNDIAKAFGLNATPQGLRNVLMISATPYQWKHIIGQRVCRRNTDETRIVLLKIWQELYTLSPALFAPGLTGPFCQRDKCLERKMTCGRKINADMTPEDLLKADYPALWEGGGV